MATCSDLCIGVCARADAAHSNDGQLALRQPVHVPQHLRGHVKERRPTQSTNLRVTMQSYLTVHRPENNHRFWQALTTLAQRELNA